MKSYVSQRDILTLGFFCFLSIVLVGPVSSNTHIPALADYINHLSAIIQSKLALLEGQFPLRVAPFEHAGHRYPYFQFYSPSVFTFTGILYSYVVANPLVVFKITLCTTLTLGGIYMYRLAYWFVQSWQAAILSGVIYLTAPYYLIVINQLGNITEASALGLIPATVFYTLNFYLYPRKYATFLKASFFWYLLITVHVVSFVYTALFVFIWLLLITFRNKNHYRNYISTLIMYAFACLLAAWYIMPIDLFSAYFLLSATYQSATDFVTYSPTLSELLFPSVIFSNGSLLALDTMHPCIGWPIILAVILCMYAIYNKERISNRRANYILPSLLSIFWLAFLMVWSPINFWEWLPQTFLIGQYSWRILSQVIWIGALLSAWAIVWLFKNKFATKQLVIAVFILMLSVTPLMKPLGVFKTSLQDFIKKPEFSYQNNSYNINFNKFPNYVIAIDAMMLDPLIANATLQLANTYNIVPELLKLNPAPMLTIAGNVSDDIAKQNLHLNAIVDDKIIASYKLSAGDLFWKIPLLITDNTKKIKLNFSINAADHQPISPEKIALNINKITLSGFLAADKTMAVQEAQQYCKLNQDVLVCTIKANANLNLIELPVIYYPDLLEVMLNNHIVNYQSVLYEERLLVSVVPEKNQTNIIKIKFIGSHLGNLISLLAWFFWAMILITTIYLSLTKGFHKKI